MKWETELKHVIVPLYSHLEFSIVWTGTDSYRALKRIEAEQPDIAIIDYHLDHVTGLDLAPSIKRKCPGVGIILLSPYDDEYCVSQALSKGVSGYLVWNSDIHILACAIHLIHTGGQYISPKIVIRAFQSLPRLQPQNSVKTRKIKIHKDYTIFSRTDWQIIEFIEQGKTTKEIAESLFLTTGTIRNYISQMMRKTKSRTRLEMARAVLKASRQNAEAADKDNQGAPNPGHGSAKPPPFTGHCPGLKK
jgi:DNA-binding NarL/FixJ family response regulator